jgi:hypothetical protein
MPGAVGTLYSYSHSWGLEIGLRMAMSGGCPADFGDAGITNDFLVEHEKPHEERQMQSSDARMPEFFTIVHQPGLPGGGEAVVYQERGTNGDDAYVVG